MKLLIALSVSFFALTVHAAPSSYSCDFKKLLAVGAEYENINDFTFNDYPYLLINLEDNQVVSVSIGAMEYAANDGYEFMIGATKDASTIKIIRLAEEGFPLYKAYTIFLPKNDPKAAIVESHEEELEGQIAEFGNCQ